MEKEERMPTEREWLLMEVVWDSEDQPTSAQIHARLDPEAGMDGRTVRVLLHHLCKKGLLSYTVDPCDGRVYHYRALRGREECRREKSRSFVRTYFRGSGSGAAAAFLRDAAFTDEQLRELAAILEERREEGKR